MPVCPFVEENDIDAIEGGTSQCMTLTSFLHKHGVDLTLHCRTVHKDDSSSSSAMEALSSQVPLERLLFLKGSSIFTTMAFTSYQNNSLCQKERQNYYRKLYFLISKTNIAHTENMNQQK
jgi:hypothetical protein